MTGPAPCLPDKLDEEWSFLETLRHLVFATDRGISADELNRQVASPNGGTTAVRSCLHVVFRDEWWHDQYANRDLAILERR